MHSGTTISVLPAPEGGTAKPGANKPQVLLDVPYGVDQFRVSPDGRWVAYMSQESGQTQVNVAVFPSFTNRRQISTSPATAPLWRADGKELFFRGEGGRVLAVDVKSGGATFETGPVRTLFRGSPLANNATYLWAVTRDGQRFLMLEPPGISTNTVEQLHVIANWPALVK
jgi:hypothetical protein